MHYNETRIRELDHLCQISNFMELEKQIIFKGTLCPFSLSLVCSFLSGYQIGSRDQIGLVFISNDQVRDVMGSQHN